MFTGIVEEVGNVRSIAKKGETLQLRVEAKEILKDVKIGDSIAVNGVCLTVTEFEEGMFAADVMPETFRHTNLGKLKVGDKVNLERAMSLDRRFGGHFVQGHVDTIATITKTKPEQNAVIFTFRPQDSSVMKYIVPRGSVALDGISLTVINVSGDQFSVSIIPHTLKSTVLKHKNAGDTVNLECDMLGKYVECLLRFLPLGNAPENGRGPGRGLHPEF